MSHWDCTAKTNKKTPQETSTTPAGGIGLPIHPDKANTKTGEHNCGDHFPLGSVILGEGDNNNNNKETNNVRVQPVGGRFSSELLAG